MAMWTRKTADDPPRCKPPQGARPRREAKMQPPLTPMIDVTFQLLLFFLLTFTFRQAEGQIPGSLPGCTPGPWVRQPLRIILRPIGLDRTGVVYEVKGWAHLLRTPKELGQVLDRFARQEGSREAEVIIEPRGDVQWRWAVEAFNQSVRADLQRVRFARPT